MKNWALACLLFVAPLGLLCLAMLPVYDNCAGSVENPEHFYYVRTGVEMARVARFCGWLSAFFISVLIFEKDNSNAARHD